MASNFVESKESCNLCPDAPKGAIIIFELPNSEPYRKCRKKRFVFVVHSSGFMKSLLYIQLLSALIHSGKVTELFIKLLTVRIWTEMKEEKSHDELNGMSRRHSAGKMAVMKGKERDRERS